MKKLSNIDRAANLLSAKKAFWANNKAECRARCAKAAELGNHGAFKLYSDGELRASDRIAKIDLNLRKLRTMKLRLTMA